jgi:glucose/arabinose dehydrogenase
MRRNRGFGVCALGVAVAALVACSDNGAQISPSPSPSPTAAACGAGTPVAGFPALTARLVAGGFQQPLDLKVAPGDRERLYVVEQGGRIRIVRGGQLTASPFLDISNRISCCGERGLLGLAFHPKFATNRRFFVNYTDGRGDTHIAEFRAASAEQADAASEKLILFVAQPFANHNGGGLAFGNDGYLYVGLGDGGSGGDPLGNGQSLSTFLGKMLRLDVDSASPYAIPTSNPIRTTGALREIWAYGLRNPFRFSFDPATGDLYIGDVGQNSIEEIDIGLASRMGGENYGWNTTEGSACFSPSRGCVTTGITMPVAEYGHDEGCSVTGGVVYRGCRMPGLVGTYFYGDYCSAFVRSFRYAAGQVTERRDWTPGLKGIDQISSFGTDADGEVYVVDYQGEVYQLVPSNP